ncbi:MAG: hypothetical protein OXF74_04415 [Rhodobacteraceae bacterium]|nr:hypothetical protein [Paracoccaceae bacterium]
MSLFSVAGWAVTLFVPIWLLAGIWTVSYPVRLSAAALTVAAFFAIELNDLALIGYPRGLLSEPSIGLVAYFLFLLTPRPSRHQSNRFHYAAFLVGILLYPMALGLGAFDPYALGYHPSSALVVAAAAAAAWWCPGLRLIAVWLTSALLAHTFQIGDSDNLFDYILDPVLFSLAAIRVIRRSFTLVVSIHAKH